MNKGNRFFWVFLDLSFNHFQSQKPLKSIFTFIQSSSAKKPPRNAKLSLFLRFYAKCKTNVLEIKKIFYSFLDRFCSRRKLTQRYKTRRRPREENKSRFLSFVRAFDQVASAHRFASYLLRLLCLCLCLCLWQNWRNFRQLKAKVRIFKI